jgi:hypothetical protein
MTTIQPRFAHDGCPECRFLGHQDADHDAYYCLQPAVGIPTIILRYGDEPDAYVSGVQLFDRLTPELKDEARKRLVQDPDVKAILSILEDAGGELHVEQLEHRFVQGEGRS